MGGETRAFGLSRSSTATATGTGAGLLSPRGPGLKTDGMGPRTIKALTAAGLLDRDREGNLAPSPASSNTMSPTSTNVGSASAGSRPGSRFGFGSVKSYNGADREFGAPSRLAFSEVGSGSTRSVSRAMTTVSDEVRGSHRRARTGSVSTGVTGTLDTQRTSYSTTGPTSVVTSNGLGSSTKGGGPSPRLQQQSQQAASSAIIQSLQEKHSMETSALLSALADSQRTAQDLREENGRLEERVRELEAALEDANALVRRYQGLMERQNVDAGLRERRFGTGLPRERNSEWEWERERELELEMEREMGVGTSSVAIRRDGRMEMKFSERERDSLPMPRTQSRTVLNRIGSSHSRPASSDGPTRTGSLNYHRQTPARERIYGHAAPQKSMSLSVAVPRSREPSRSPLIQPTTMEIDHDFDSSERYEVEDDDDTQRRNLHHGEGRALGFLGADLHADSLQVSVSDDDQTHDSETTSAYRTHRQRASGTSSIFAMPPPNMTLLMQEDGFTAAQSTFNAIGDGSASLALDDLRRISRPRPPSGSVSIPIRAQSSHRSQASDSSVATSVRGGVAGSVRSAGSATERNMSPTTMASFSTTTNGSPRSLSLATEHELHLADVDVDTLSLAEMYAPIAGSEYDDEGEER